MELESIDHYDNNAFTYISFPSRKPYSKAINPFHATDSFLYPLKTSENQIASDISGGIKKDQSHEMG